MVIPTSSQAISLPLSVAQCAVAQVSGCSSRPDTQQVALQRTGTDGRLSKLE